MQFLVMFAEKRSPRNIFVQIKVKLPPPHRARPPGPPGIRRPPMIIKRNSLEFSTNIVVTFPLKYVSRLIPFSLKNVNHHYVSYKLQTLLISTNVCLLLSICKVIYLKKYNKTMKLMVGFAMFGNQLTLWNLLKIVMSELYKRFVCVEPANKVKRL